jgi:hypothetical protein
MKISSIFLIAISVLLISTPSYGQGCSDAGFCTLSGLKPQTDSVRSSLAQIKAGMTIGWADHDITVLGSYLEFGRALGRNISLEMKLTSLQQMGNGITSFGLSDVFITAQQKLSKRVDVSAGFKIPLSDANRMQNGLPLPMDYQSSLGTLDVIVGLGFRHRALQLAAGFQQPLTQNNNQFLASDYSSDSKLSIFQSTKDFRRRGDLLLRASYRLMVDDKLKITLSALPIYHLSEDTFTDASGVEQIISGSNGLTLNGNLFVDYAWNDRHALQFIVASPFVVRASRPDGLTRSLILNLEYRLRL